MKSFQLIRRWLRGTCVWFTLVAMAMLIVGAITPTVAATVNVTSFLFFFPFAMLISLANQLLRLQSMPRWARFLLHYFLTVFGFVLFFWFPSNTSAHAATVLLLMVLVTVIYWILFVLIHTFYKRIKHLLEED